MDFGARLTLDCPFLLSVLACIDAAKYMPDERARRVREVYESVGRLHDVDDGRFVRSPQNEPLLVRALAYALEPPPLGPDLTVELFGLMHEPDPRCPCTDGQRCREMTRGRPCAEHRQLIERRRAVVRSAEPALLATLPPDVVRAVLAPLEAHVLVGAAPTAVDDALSRLVDADPTSDAAQDAWRELMAAYAPCMK
jgi:hypothetical protein